MPSSAEGIELRGRWGRREFVPWDEVAGHDERSVTLASGETRRLPEALRDTAARALCPPGPTGTRSADAQAFVEYVAGAWSPVRAASALLAIAATGGASDVHVEAEDGSVAIRWRVTGELGEFVSLEPATGRRLLAALKHLAGCLPYRSDIVQEGSIPREGVAADVRASFLPTALGERAALRLFGRLLTLSELGLESGVLERFEALLGRRSGLVLVAGPSGGGKTTTVYAALAALTTRRSGAHLSIEEPVEQRLRLAGIPVDQVELCPERGLTGEAALVGALRQDVDVVAFAEIRTPAEAKLAVQAAHTGRLVVAGVHAGDAAQARQRMLDLDADPAVLAATLQGVLHQRLEPVDCGSCEGPACARCRGTGRVRRPVGELWTKQEEAP